jgi:hypothetical protein
MNAGDFRVINDTGAVVTSFSLILDTPGIAAAPAQQSDCGSGAPACENFQIHGGAANYFSTLSLTGPGCVAHCGTASADFKSGPVSPPEAIPESQSARFST